MRTKRKAIDLVAYKDGQKIAFEIETGKNSKKQIIENIKKCLNSDVDRLYLIAINSYAFRKIMKVLTDLPLETRISLIEF